MASTRCRAGPHLWRGCLPSILQLFGTPWSVSYLGRIVLLELPEGLEAGSHWPLGLARWNLGDLGTRIVHWDEIVGLRAGENLSIYVWKRRRGSGSG